MPGARSASLKTSAAKALLGIRHLLPAHSTGPAMLWIGARLNRGCEGTPLARLDRPTRTRLERLVFDPLRVGKDAVREPGNTPNPPGGRKHWARRSLTREYYRVLGPGRVETFIDTTGDANGVQKWTHLLCEKVAEERELGFVHGDDCRELSVDRTVSSTG